MRRRILESSGHVNTIEENETENTRAGGEMKMEESALEMEGVGGHCVKDMDTWKLRDEWIPDGGRMGKCPHDPLLRWSRRRMGKAEGCVLLLTHTTRVQNCLAGLR